MACYDINKPQSDKFAAELGMVDCDLVPMLARDDVQGVVIASPNNAHRENVEAVVGAGEPYSSTSR